jgi:hypothetical protein
MLVVITLGHGTEKKDRRDVMAREYAAGLVEIPRVDFIQMQFGAHILSPSPC